MKRLLFVVRGIQSKMCSCYKSTLNKIVYRMTGCGGWHDIPINLLIKIRLVE